MHSVSGTGTHRTVAGAPARLPPIIPSKGGANGRGAIATIGNDLILIAAYSDNAAADSSGVIHLFATNGALLNTITNPQPTDNAEFGYSLAVVEMTESSRARRAIRPSVPLRQVSLT